MTVWYVELDYHWDNDVKNVSLCDQDDDFEIEISRNVELEISPFWWLL